MNIKEFVAFVDKLPDDCIEKKTDEEIVFHLPLTRPPCTRCGSKHVVVERYRKQKIYVSDTTTYIYRKRSYKCASCGVRFFEPNPFLGFHQRWIGDVPLRLFRGNKKITLRKMVTLLNVPFHVYKELENGEIPSSLELAGRVADILSVRIEDIWGAEAEEKIRAKEQVLERKKQQAIAKNKEKNAIKEEFSVFQKNMKNLSLRKQKRILEMLGDLAEKEAPGTK